MHRLCSMVLPQVACLVPLDDYLKESDSEPRIVLSEGPNTIGRGNFSVVDKRLSRKHLLVTASAQGDSASLLVEGTNPVIVKSGAGRKKICTGEELMIGDGDVIELIPGHYFFKFVAFPSDNTSKNECKDNGSNERAQKKARRGEVQGDDSKEAIRDFHLRDDEVHQTFRLLRVQGLPSWANTSCVSIEDIIQGDIVVAILSNYMVDVDWLVSACPRLGKIPKVLVIHGEGDGRQEYMQRKKPTNWILHKPRLPISFGTHHSKAIILIYPRGVRIVVHTANLIYVDWNNKTQGLWMQDFPWKNGESPKMSGFEGDLIDYLGVLKWPEFSASIPGRGILKIDSSFFKMFNYADATVRLVASVPGYHTSTSLRKWGHMKLRTILDVCNFDNEFKKSPLIYQFSSLGSLDEKWLREFTSSMSAGLSEDKTPLGDGDPQIIWPTVEDVRCSIEGYAAGNAVPSPLKNVEKGFLKKYWFKWKADHSGRCRAMPHIKTFTRYKDQKLAWFLLTSSNLSKAAWGALQKNNSQLMIRSYELGVLFIPSLIRRRARFSCTSNIDPVQDTCEPVDNNTDRTKFVTLTWQGVHDTASSADVIRLPVPYKLPPQQYSSEDVPWSWDRTYSKKDVYGQVWPRQVQLYATDRD